MIILAVHSSSPYLGAAVLRDGEILSRRVLPAGRRHLEQVAGVVQDVVNEAKIAFKDLTGLGTAIGPGSFSGIRVGISFIKGLSSALGKPVAGIPSLEIAAAQVLDKGENGIAVIDAKRGEVYAAAYRNIDGRFIELISPALIRAERFGEQAAATHCDRLVVCGEPIIESLGTSSDKIVRTEVVIPSPEVCARQAWVYFQEGRQNRTHSLAPLYIRRSDAEEKR